MHPSRGDQIEIEDDFNYFANRKPSKSLKSFIPGFNMKQKTKKSVGLDLRVRHRMGRRSKEPSAASTASAASTSQGKKRTLVRAKPSEKENRSNVAHQSGKEGKPNVDKEAVFIVDDDDDGDDDGNDGDGNESVQSRHSVEKAKAKVKVKVKPKRTFISDEDEPESRPSMHVSHEIQADLQQKGQGRDNERGRVMLQGRMMPFEPEPIDSSRDPLLPVSWPKHASGHRSKAVPSPVICPADKGDEPLRISLDTHELTGGFDDDTAMQVDACAGVNRAPPVDVAPSVARICTTKQDRKSFSEIYKEACRFAVPPIQVPLKSLLARLAFNEAHLQLDGLGMARHGMAWNRIEQMDACFSHSSFRVLLGLGLVGSMELLVFLKSLARITQDYAIEHIDLSDNHLDDSFLIEWSKSSPDMSHVITFNVSRNFFTQKGLESLLCPDTGLRWPALKSLDCSWNSLNESSQLLASLLRMHLENLFLSHNPTMSIGKLPCRLVNDTIVRLSVGSNGQLCLGSLLSYVGDQCRTLDLSALSFLDTDELVNLELLKYHQLERLCLAHSTGLSLDTLSTLIQNNRQTLRHLDFCFSSCSISALQLFTLPFLSTLLLDGARVNVSDLVHLVESSLSESLHEIGLAHCGLNHRGIDKHMVCSLKEREREICI